MISAIGTVITCLSVMGFGYSYGIHLKKERQNLRGMISLTERIRARIECFRQTLPEIYADFSGYMDIMCGFCEMFDIRLAENFERPYFSKSIAEYWRR